VTPAEPSQCGASAVEVAGTLLAMYWVVIGTDERGSCSRLLRENDDLLGGNVRWRLIGQTDDPAEAARLARQAHQQCSGHQKSGAHASLASD
jgi:hypothetical protein